jgi:Xaa-Pro dipeptidase
MTALYKQSWAHFLAEDREELPASLAESFTMTVHFTRDEFESRISRARASLADRELDGILLFAPESHFYLSGFDTFGFAMFQCLILDADDQLHLFARTPDFRQAQQTSILDDSQIHIWVDVEGVSPTDELRGLLGELGLLGKRLGIETNTVGLTAYNWQALDASLKGQVELVEASSLVTLLRRDKSATEIDYHRRAASLSDDSLDAAIELTSAGAYEGDILAAMQGAVFKGGGDYAGNEFVIGSGPAALLCRYQSGRRHLQATDQLTLEWAGAYCRYHAAMMRTLLVGKANDAHKRMHSACVEALEACEAAIRPGDPMGNVFDAHAMVFKKHGLSHAQMHACGYGMGAIYNPIWVDFPMFYKGNPLIMNAGNVYFLHMILMDSESGLAMCWGHSVLVNDNGVERLSRSSLELVAKA